MMTTTPAPAPRLRSRRLGAADLRLAWAFASSALFDTYRPLLVFLNVTRRCNLSCSYCREFDAFSPPVPLDILYERIDHLARLRTAIVNLNGGEPLLHPGVVEVVARIRDRGMVPAMNTNGFLITKDLIQRLDRAGLHTMQISADAVRPNATTAKSLKSLLPAFRLLAEHARFRVQVNTVLGAAPPEEAVEVARVALAHGFAAKCALLRVPDGGPMAFGEGARRAYEAIGRLRGRWLGVFGEGFQDELLREGRVQWKCRAGARFFHVCDKGLVHLCGPRMGEAPKPLAGYGDADLRRAFDARKRCASRCAVAYAHMVSRVDRLRAQRDGASDAATP